MDNFCEQLVQKRKSGADILKTVTLMLSLIIGSAVCTYLSFFKSLSFMLIIAAGLVALGVWLVMGMNVEYEYIITNNEMDIDKIIGRRKRKRMITVDLSKSKDFGVYPNNEEVDADTTVHASTGLTTDARYLLIEHSEYGKVKIIFNPNEKLREAIAREIPKSVSARLK